MKFVLNIETLSAADGGPPRAVLAIAKELALSGADVTIVARRPDKAALAEGVEEAVLAGVHLELLDEHRRFDVLARLRQTRASIARARGSDLVSCHGFYHFTVVVATAASILTGAKLVIQPHGVFEPYQEAKSPRRKSFFNRVVGYASMRRASALLVASNQELEGVGISHPSLTIKTVIVGMGVSPQFTVRHRRDWTERRVLFLSRIAPKKRLDLLLDAIQITQDSGIHVSLDVCGDGDRQLVRQLQERAATLTDVAWHGYMDGMSRADLEGKATLFCLPSDNENYGQAVTEALAAGLPVITTDTVGAGAHVSAAQAGWVLHAPSAEDLADTIINAFKSPETLATMSVRGSTYAARNLSWRPTAEHWVNLASTKMANGLSSSP